jgi:hypothetical protein
MASNDRVERWIKRVLSDPIILRAETDKPRRCTMLALLHVTGGRHDEVQSLKLGSKSWEPKGLADMFNGIADEHAAGLASSESGSGQESYRLVAFYDDMPDLEQNPLPLMRKTGASMLGEEGTAIVTEPPNARGETGQNMRERSAWMNFILEKDARLYGTMVNVIDRLSARLGTVERENQDAFTLAKEMILEKAADSHDQRMRELAFERSSEERARVMKALPPLVNRVFGKEIFPTSTVDSTLIESLVESLDEKTMSRVVEAVLPVLPPETATLLMARFGDIQLEFNRRKAEAAKRAASKANANGNGNGAPKT